MKTLHLSALTLLTLTGVFSDSSKWRVNYSEPICAVRGSSVSISCTYFYPPSHVVQRVLWCSNNNTESYCRDPPYVYDSNSSIASEGFEFVGNKTSNCTLLIRNVQFSHSGGYKFRFLIDDTTGKWTGLPGATLNVTDLELSMTNSSGNQTLKEGDSVNLTCAVNCTPSSPQFVWFKNGERLPESDPQRKTGSEKLVVTGCLSGHREEHLSPCIIKHTYNASVLHFRNLTVGDSGRYSCALKTDESVRSEPVQLNIGGSSLWILFTALVIVGLMVMLIVLAVIYRRKKTKAQEEDKEREKKTQVGESTCGEQTQHLYNQGSPPTETLLQEGDVTYASVGVQHKKPKKVKETEAQDENRGNGRTSQSDTLLQEGDVTYASVTIDHKKPKKRPSHPVQQQEDDSVIYSAVVTRPVK